MTAKKDSLDKQRKLDWSLLMVDLRPELRQVAKVLHYAAYDKPNAYGPRNWMNGGDEFFAELWSALDRHRDAVHDGIERDAESCEDHIAHMICGLLFLLARKRLGRTETSQLEDGNAIAGAFVYRKGMLVGEINGDAESVYKELGELESPFTYALFNKKGFVVGQGVSSELPKRPTLYDWTDPSIPERATHIATDKSGIVFAYEVTDGITLTPDEMDGEWMNNGNSNMKYERLKFTRPDLAENWRESLEARPTESTEEAGE